MIQRQLKLRLNSTQERMLCDWLWHLIGVWNWAIRKIELDANDGIFYTPKAFHNLLAGHSKTLGIPSHTLQGTLATAHTAWDRCFKKLAKRPKLKGHRNRLNSIPFPDPFCAPAGNHIKIPGLGSVRFHKQPLPDGKIKSGRIMKRASGWYLCLFINAEPNPIEATGSEWVGIDPGFKDLLALSTGDTIPHPRELEQTAERLAQAQRGGNQRLAARLQERLANQRKDRNHKLSRDLVSQFEVMVFSKDNHRAIAKTFGKSVASSSHSQLRTMLAYKCRAGGRQFIEAGSRNSTRTCSACGALTGPTGYAGLSVRQWVCPACGADHDRDINAAINTLKAGAGIALERHREMSPGIPRL
jgi:transposase